MNNIATECGDTGTEGAVMVGLSLREEQKIRLAVLAVVAAALTACSAGGDGDSVTVEGDVPIAYVKRPTSTLGNPTDSIMTGQGGDLYVREKSSPSAPEVNITNTNGGDVSDPEVSYDGTKILFAMRGPNDARWGIWEYNRTNGQKRQIVCDATDLSTPPRPIAGDDVDPAYLPDGGIVFSSNRQVGTWRQMQANNETPYKYVDEYEREVVTALHVMDNDGRNCRQISFNQSHDRNPTVLSTGEIMFSRWDHVGERNQFSIFRINPNGTDPFIMYGAHGVPNSYLHPREMQDGRVMSTLMPLSGTKEGGSIEIIDKDHYVDVNEHASNPPANQLGEIAGQFQITRLLFPSSSQADQQATRGMNVSRLGRYSSPYPLWDGTGRALVVFSPCRVIRNGTVVSCQDRDVRDNLNDFEEADPAYGIYMLNPQGTLRVVVPPQDRFYYSDPVVLQPRSLPVVKSHNFTRDNSIPLGMGRLSVNSVYDTDGRGNMSAQVLVPGESIAGNTTPNIAAIQNDPNRVARFFRISKAVPTPGGLGRNVIGETEFEMQQILGYGVIERDGSISVNVPGNTPITITALDRHGRAFTPHTNWIQALDGEKRFCKGCHSARLTTTNPNGTVLNSAPMADSNIQNLRGSIAYTPVLPGEQPISIDYAASFSSVYKPASCATTWVPGTCSIVINYPEHIQPIWDRARTGPNGENHSCSNSACHGGAAPAAGLYLAGTNAQSDQDGLTGRLRSYQRFMIGDPVLVNGLPDVNIDEDGEVEIRRDRNTPVIAGNSRRSRLIERLFEQRLQGAGSENAQEILPLANRYCRWVDAATLDCPFSGAPGAPPPRIASTLHASMLSAEEKRLVSEWIDLGAQYFNNPRDNSGNLRSVMGQLNQATFACVQPLLQANCASCHQPFSGGTSGTPNQQFAQNPNRFILTNNLAADFSVTASMITNLGNPALSYLLVKPSGVLPQHPTNLLNDPTADPASLSRFTTTVQNWIANSLSLPCP